MKNCDIHATIVLDTSPPMQQTMIERARGFYKIVKTITRIIELTVQQYMDVMTLEQAMKENKSNPHKDRG